MTIAQPNIIVLQARIKGPGSDDGLSALISGHAAQKPEERRDVRVDGEHRFEELLRKYEKFLNVNKPEYGGLQNRKHFVSLYVTEILTPKKINLFLQLLTLFEEHDPCFFTGEFVSQLIQNSYNVGYNDFNLNIKNFSRIDSLGTFLRGTPARLVNIHINGKTVHTLGFYSSYSSFTLNDDCEELLLIMVEGENCILRTPSIHTLENCLRYVPKNRNNKIYFINLDGTEELMRTN